MDSSYTHSWLCQRIVDESHVAIVYADREGIIRLWNAGAEAMFGYPAGEAVGHTMEMIIPEKHRARHDEGYHRVMHSVIMLLG